ncbi:MAG: cytochrome c biogenesis protein CcsA [Gammaproteobacteria bacterium]|nr:cytochrome c biogenesis protein CcsA [Gammaproteobacteria bacterium]
MTTIIISFTAIILYCVTGFLLAYSLYKRGNIPLPRGGLIAMGLAASALHAVTLHHNIFTTAGLNLGFFNAFSLLSWLIALLVLLTSLNKPVENLGIAVFPLAGLALAVEMIFPTSNLILEKATPGIQAHIIISILAYSVVSISAVQAILLSIQDRHLRARHPGGFIRALPPLATMETLLFQMIGLGFVLQSLSLLSGAVFLENMFAQHLVHKTVLGIIAWLVFAVLLWGRWRFGWRGRTAIRWTLSGAVTLMLAYFGSKLVLELLLHR